jgi:adenylate kinase
MAKIIYMGGIPAAGKTSVLNGARSKNVDSGVQYIEGTLFMKNVANEKLGRKFSTLEIEGMDIDDKVALVRRSWQEAVNLPAKVIVVEGRYMENDAGSYREMIPKESLQHISSFVLIESNPVVIMARRKKDSEVKPFRDLSFINIPLEAIAEREYAVAASRLANKDLLIIKNIDGALNSTIDELTSLVRRVSISD